MFVAASARAAIAKTADADVAIVAMITRCIVIPPALSENVTRLANGFNL